MDNLVRLFCVMSIVTT